LKIHFFKKYFPRRDFFKKRHTINLLHPDYFERKKNEGHRIGNGNKG